LLVSLNFTSFDILTRIPWGLQIDDDFIFIHERAGDKMNILLIPFGYWRVWIKIKLVGSGYQAQPYQEHVTRKVSLTAKLTGTSFLHIESVLYLEKLLLLLVNISY
jgi:hypothetical protein